jgi:hypothetical protein
MEGGLQFSRAPLLDVSSSTAGASTPLDEEKGVMQLGGSRSTYHATIKRFATEYLGKSIDELKQAHHAMNSSELHKAAHSLKVRHVN